MSTFDRSLPASACLRAASNWPSWAWLKVMSPASATADLDAAGAEDDPEAFLEQAAVAVSSAATATIARRLLLILRSFSSGGLPAAIAGSDSGQRGTRARGRSAGASRAEQRSC